MGNALLWWGAHSKSEIKTMNQHHYQKSTENAISALFVLDWWKLIVQKHAKIKQADVYCLNNNRKGYGKWIFAILWNLEYIPVLGENIAQILLKRIRLKQKRAQIEIPYTSKLTTVERHFRAHIVLKIISILQNYVKLWIFALIEVLISLREKSSYSKLFWSAFSRIQTKYEKILRISTYTVRMRENADQNNSKHGYFLRKVYL